jgi:hypothetical protein
VLVYVLGGVGALICFFTWQALRVSPDAVESLLGWWEQHGRGRYVGPDVIGTRVERKGFKALLWPWNALPLIISVAWLLLIIDRLLSH